jgi:HSP20 family protein
MGGQFSRSVTLPVEIDTDKCEARFEHGVLHLALPKTAAHQPKRIQIQGGQSSQPTQIEAPTGKQKAA